MKNTSSQKRRSSRPIKEHETGRKAEDICRELTITTATFYKWRQRYSGMEASDVKKMEDLEEEECWSNGDVCKPKPGARSLKGCSCKKALRPEEKGMLVQFMIEEHGVGQRQACSTLSVPRSSIQYHPKFKNDTPVINALQALLRSIPPLVSGRAITILGAKAITGIT